MWDVVFKPAATRRRWYVDEEDLGVRRCASCGFEIDGRWCHHCDEQFSDISDEASENTGSDDSEHYSSNDSLDSRIPRAFFADRELEAEGEELPWPEDFRWPGEGRWPGEASEDDMDDDEDDEFYGRAREWRVDPDDDNGMNADRDLNVRLVGRERPRNVVQRQDFHFGFGGADLGHASGDEGDSYEGSFIDDDDAGMERHFVRGYDYDGEDSDASDMDASGSDRSGNLDRYGRPTHLAGRQVAYSPSDDES